MMTTTFGTAVEYIGGFFSVTGESDDGGSC
jgi:hypothetical protein